MASPAISSAPHTVSDARREGILCHEAHGSTETVTQRSFKFDKSETSGWIVERDENIDVAVEVCSPRTCTPNRAKDFTPHSSRGFPGRSVVDALSIPPAYAAAPASTSSSCVPFSPIAS